MIQSKYLFTALLTAFLFLQACSDNKKDFLITIKTNYGDIKLVLYDQTPKHKDNFIKLTESGFYDSLLFHRVINNFMIQSGDPNSKGSLPGQSLGNGGPGYTIPPEFVPGIIHERGTIAAARMGDNVNPKKESSGSQFYLVQGKVYTAEELEQMSVKYNELYQYFGNLCERSTYQEIAAQANQLQLENRVEELQELILSLKDTIEQEYDIELDNPFTQHQIERYTTVGGVPHLDGGYTVFGKVVEGIEVIDNIAAVATDGSDRPNENVIMTVEVEKLSRKKIEKLYGYHYPSE